jgi:hypothetical protein
VVVADVPDFALVAGVPARWLRWVGHAGVPLDAVGEGLWKCPQTGRTYRERPADPTGDAAPAAAGPQGTVLEEVDNS